MTVITDTNIIIAALVRNGPVRGILLAHPGCFATPIFCIEEVWEHRDVWGRHGLTDEELREEIGLVALGVLDIVFEDVYSSKTGEAGMLTDDPDDVPVVALALAIENEGLWTFNTRDFAKPELRARIRVLGTSDVSRLFQK